LLNFINLPVKLFLFINSPNYYYYPVPLLLVNCINYAKINNSMSWSRFHRLYAARIGRHIEKSRRKHDHACAA